MNGASLLEIAGILGHKTLQMVKRYSHLSEDHKTEVLNKINQKVFGRRALPHKRTAILLKKSLRKNLQSISQLIPEALTKKRYEKFRKLGEIGFEVTD